MQTYRGLVTTLVSSVLTLSAAQSAVAQNVVPVPWWMFNPDLWVESITASQVYCGSTARKVKFAVTIRNGGYKTANMPAWPYGSWGHIEQITASYPTANDDMYWVYSIPAGKTKTFENTLSVVPTASPFTPPGTVSVGVKVTVDPQNFVKELNELNNYTEKWFSFAATCSASGTGKPR
jgi:hypothetical protein